MSLFYGSGVALVTPFKNYEVDYDLLKELIEWHIENHTDALIVCGTTGESPTLTLSEKKGIIKFTVDVVNKRIPVIAGCGTNCTNSTIELSMFAESVGADGLLLVVPYYNKPTQKGLYAHFATVAQLVKIPIILYNVPSRTGVNLEPDTVYQLSKVRHIEGIKEASGNLSQVKKIRELCDDDFLMYSGNDDQLLPILEIGGIGVISVTANILPKEIHSIVWNYFNGEKEKAKEEFEELQELNHVLFIESNPIPIKKAMNLMGMEVGDCRLPLIEMDFENYTTLKKTLEKYGLIEGKK